MHKFLFYNKFIICLYVFRALCVHHQEVNIVLYSIWYHHTCRWPSRAQAESSGVLFSAYAQTRPPVLLCHVGMNWAKRLYFRDVNL